MKKILFVIVALIAILGVASCHRTCHCYGWDGSHTYFSDDEIDTVYGGSCTDLAIHYGEGRYYSLCEWE